VKPAQQNNEEQSCDADEAVLQQAQKYENDNEPALGRNMRKWRIRPIIKESNDLMVVSVHIHLSPYDTDCPRCMGDSHDL